MDVEDKVLDIAFEMNLKYEVYISPRVIDRATLNDPVWRITPFVYEGREILPLKASELEALSIESHSAALDWMLLAKEALPANSGFSLVDGYSTP